MIEALLVAVGGGLGAAARWQLGVRLTRRWGGHPRKGFWAQPGRTRFAPLPLDVLVINTLGSALIGVLAALTWSGFRIGSALPVANLPGFVYLRTFAVTGFCGGFTTYSTAAVGAAKLIRGGHPLRGLGYAGLSVLLSVAAVALGWALGWALI